MTPPEKIIKQLDKKSISNPLPGIDINKFPKTTEEHSSFGYYWGIYDALLVLRNAKIIKDFNMNSREITFHDGQVES